MGASSSAGVASPDAAPEPVPQRTNSDELPTSSMPAANGRSRPLMAHPVHLGSGGGEEADEDELLDEEDAGASSVSSVFTMCNSAIGAGVLSLPYAFRCAGALGCLLACIALGVGQGLTLYTLSKFAERYDAHTYSVLVRRALGRKLALALSATLMFYQLGSCAAYLIIVGDTFGSLIAQEAGSDVWYAQRNVIISLVTVFVVLPMCFPRNLSSLHWISTAGVCGFIYTAIAIVYESSKIISEREDRWDGARLIKFDFQALFAIPIIVFGFNCHANVVSVFNELVEEPKVLVAALPRDPAEYRRTESVTIGPKPRTRKMIGMISVILAAVFIIFAGYLAVGFAGYLAYPTTVDSNVLKSFPKRPVLLKIARAAIGCVVIGHYPLNAHPARVGLEHLESYFFGWRHISPALGLLQTVGFVGVSLAIALVVTDLGQVLHMIGGTAAAFIIFFLPGLLLVNAAIVKLDAPPGHTASGDLDAEAPLLADENERGIKRTGLIYSPRRSWWLGIGLIALSVCIFTITIVTAFYHP